MRSPEIDAIITAASTALTPSPDICGCPDTVAMLAAPAIQRAAAERVEDVTSCRDLLRWADQIDDLAATASNPSDVIDSGAPFWAEES